MSQVIVVPEAVLAALAAKLARSACTFLAVLAAVAAGAVLLIAVLMPFVFPLSLPARSLAQVRGAPAARERDGRRGPRRRRTRGLTARSRPPDGVTFIKAVRAPRPVHPDRK